jgi:GntR family transcriptional regulator/MocR family aminotransferase
MSVPIELDRSSPEPLYRQVERQLRAAIESGRLRPGDRVRSVRALAADLDVGRLTIATAYEQLAADGYLVGRVGFGTVVAPDPPGRDVEEVEAAGPRRRPSPDGPVRRPPIERPPVEVPTRVAVAGAVASAARFDLRPGPLGGATMAAGPVLERHFRDAWRDLADGGGLPAAAPDPAGDPLLRATIAAHVRAARGGRCEPGQVVVLSGALIGISAVARLWLGPDRPLAIEDPADPAFRRALTLGGARPVPVPVDRHGIRTDQLPDGASVALVSPTVQALTGARMPLARRLRLLAWAASCGAIVVEDAQADELALGAPAGPALQGLDEDGRVVHVGAFASILHPGVRLGYAVVPRDLVDAFTGTVAALDPGATPVQQRALGRFLADGHLDRHLLRVRRALAERHEAVSDALRRELGWLVSVEPSAGGSRIVVTIEDDGWTARSVADAAAEVGVALEPLAASRLIATDDRELVVDVGRHEPADLRRAIRLVAGAVARAAGSPAIIAPDPSPRRPTATSRPWSAAGRPPMAATRSMSRVGAAVGRGEPG